MPKSCCPLTPTQVPWHYPTYTGITCAPEVHASTWSKSLYPNQACWSTPLILRKQRQVDLWEFTPSLGCTVSSRPGLCRDTCLKNQQTNRQTNKQHLQLFFKRALAILGSGRMSKFTYFSFPFNDPHQVGIGRWENSSPRQITRKN